MKEILSFGAGVQSTCLLLMSCRGLLPKLDACVFADVGNEPEDVYEHLNWCTEYAKSCDIPVHIVKRTKDGLKEDVLKNVTKEDGGRVASPPFFTATIEGQKKGISKRYCTTDYKIQPIQKFLRENIMGLKPRQRAPKTPVIRSWLGISFDEATRAKPSRDKWAINVFPFLNWGMDSPNGKVWRRYQIINWLEENYPSIKVPRSACIICPFHSNEEWRKIAENAEEWEEACKFDESIRHDKRLKGGMDDMQYLHPSCKPLRTVDLRTEEAKGQNSLWDNECEGMCGL